MKRVVLVSTVMALAGLGESLKASSANDAMEIGGSSTSGAASGTKFKDLPDEVLGIIGRKLSPKDLSELRVAAPFVNEAPHRAVGQQVWLGGPGYTYRIRSQEEFEKKRTSSKAHLVTGLNFRSIRTFNELDMGDIYRRIFISFPNLHSLDLQRNKIGSEGARALAEVLKVNQTLASLNLFENNIDNYGVRALAEALKVNTALTTLNLWRNGIGPEGVRALGEALKVNTALTTLILENNDIGPEGAAALAEALKVNTALTSLNLARNGIGPEGTRALGEALKVNTALTSLGLSWNGIGPEGARVLAEVLNNNQTLTTLNLGWNRIGPEGQAALHPFGHRVMI